MAPMGCELHGYPYLSFEVASPLRRNPIAAIPTSFPSLTSFDQLSLSARLTCDTLYTMPWATLLY